MFADACELAMQFTLPVISTRDYKGNCDAAIGSFVLLNKDGWVLTAAHIVQLFQGLAAAKEATQKYRAEVEAIESSGLVKKERQRRIRELGKDPGGAQNFSAWWGKAGKQAQLDARTRRLGNLNADRTASEITLLESDALVRVPQPQLHAPLRSEGAVPRVR
jgi:hypothetical protein